jgi:hypothetical protein
MQVLEGRYMDYIVDWIVKPIVGSAVVWAMVYWGVVPAQKLLAHYIGSYKKHLIRSASARYKIMLYMHCKGFLIFEYVRYQTASVLAFLVYVVVTISYFIVIPSPWAPQRLPDAGYFAGIPDVYMRVFFILLFANCIFAFNLVRRRIREVYSFAISAESVRAELTSKASELDRELSKDQLEKLFPPVTPPTTSQLAHPQGVKLND